jgi:hypothetical protein
MEANRMSRNGEKPRDGDTFFAGVTMARLSPSSVRWTKSTFVKQFLSALNALHSWEGVAPIEGTQVPAAFEIGLKKSLLLLSVGCPIRESLST